MLTTVILLTADIRTCNDTKALFVSSQCCHQPPETPLSDTYVTKGYGYLEYDAWLESVSHSEYETMSVTPQQLKTAYDAAESEDERSDATRQASVYMGTWRSLHRNPTGAELAEEKMKLTDGSHASAFEMYARMWQSDEAMRMRHAVPNAFEGMTVVITGGSSGMGFTTAVHAAQQGAKAVYCLARSKQYFDWHVESAREGAVESERYPFYFGPIDVRTEHLDKLIWKTADVRLLEDTTIDGVLKPGLKTIFSEINTESGGIDLVWVNAQIAYIAELHNLPPIPVWPNMQLDVTKLARHRLDTSFPEDAFMTGVIGAAYTMTAAGPYLNSSSHVVLTSSAWHWNALSGVAEGGAIPAYAISKAVMSRTLQAYDPNTLPGKVSVISPDYVLTDIVTQSSMGVSIPYVQGTIAEMRDTFAASNITRHSVLDCYVVLGATCLANLDILSDVPPDIQTTAAGLTKLFFSMSFTDAYIVNRIVQDLTDNPTDYQQVNPNVRMFLQPLFGGESGLVKGEVDKSFLTLLAALESGNPNAVKGEQILSTLGPLFSQYRRIAS